MPAVRLQRKGALEALASDPLLEGADERLSVSYTWNTPSTSHAFEVGTWEAGPHELPIAPYPSSELIFVISGSFSLTFEDRAPETFNSGDAVLITQGTRCGWKQDSHCRKYFMEVLPDQPRAKL